MATTIREVAALAGVSDATVSRVLNGSPSVTEKTRKHVLSVIEQTGYRPNLLGRNLRRMQTGNILVLLPSISNDFYSLIIRGIEDIARQQGYYALICSTYGKLKIESHYLSLLHNRLADGVIVLSSELESEQLQHLSRQHPLVFCSEYRKGLGISAVSVDNRSAGREAAEHLLSLGHRKIAFVGGTPDYLSSEDRKKGFLDATKKAGITTPPEYLEKTTYSFGGGMRVCDRLLGLSDPPTAIFAVSDSIAVGILRRITQKGLRAGRDLAVMGFDDTAIASVYSPTLTTITQPRRQLGRAAMELLLSRMEDSRQGQKKEILKLFPHQLIIRESTVPGKTGAEV